MYNRLRFLINKASKSDNYSDILGSRFGFPFTSEIIKLNQKRIIMLLNYFKQLVHKDFPDFEKDNFVITPGVSERYFYYVIIFQVIYSIDVKKNIGRLKPLYFDGNFEMFYGNFGIP